MTVRKALKRRALRVIKHLGLFEAVRDSAWRSKRLVILCYHGVSIDDEHEWDPSYYVSPSTFESRLAMLDRMGFTVVPLADGVERLYAGTLPPKSVAITFDDGLHDFGQRAHPLLAKYGFPATVYLTTYYCDRKRPAFRMLCSYILWKGRHGTLDARPFIGTPGTWDLQAAEGRRHALDSLVAAVARDGLDEDGRLSLLQNVAESAGVDLASILARRILHILHPADVSTLAAAGVHFELHTHRHRTPLDRTLFLREIDDNRERVRALSGRDPAHFCYPSGVHRPDFLPWLTEAGVKSATTCESGIASANTPTLLLPRIVDSMQLSPIEIESCLTGVRSLLDITTLRRMGRADG